MTLAGRKFTIRKQFLEDVDEPRLTEPHHGAAAAAADLPCAARRDGADRSRRAELHAAKHPKSFVSLDDADHLLRRPVTRSTSPTCWRRGRAATSRAEAAAATLRAGDRDRGFALSAGGAGRAAQPDRRRAGRVGWRRDRPGPLRLSFDRARRLHSSHAAHLRPAQGVEFGRISVAVNHGKVHADDCRDCGEGREPRLIGSNARSLSRAGWMRKPAPGWSRSRTVPCAARSKIARGGDAPRREVAMQAPAPNNACTRPRRRCGAASSGPFRRAHEYAGRSDAP